MKIAKKKFYVVPPGWRMARQEGRGVACDRKFWSLVTAGTVTVSLFVAGAIFGHVGVSLLVSSALFGDVGVSLLLAGAALAEIWVDSRSTMFGEE